MGRLIPSYSGFSPRAFSAGEWKYLDTAINVDLNSTVSLTLLNGLQPGTGASQRVGQKIMIRSVELRIFWETNAATGVEQNVRHMILLDRQANGAGPAAVTDFLATNSTMAPRALTNRKRFKILYDKAYGMGATAVQSSTPQTRVFKKYMKFKRPIIVDYNAGAGGSIADIASNALYYVTLGSEAAGNTDVNAQGTIRIRYTDM